MAKHVSPSVLLSGVIRIKEPVAFRMYLTNTYGCQAVSLKDDGLLCLHTALLSGVTNLLWCKSMNKIQRMIPPVLYCR